MFVSRRSNIKAIIKTILLKRHVSKRHSGQYRGVIVMLLMFLYITDQNWSVPTYVKVVLRNSRKWKSNLIFLFTAIPFHFYMPMKLKT